MNVSLLDFQKIHPPIHTPRFSARFRTQGSNTPQIGSFKNPFIGIEINLFKEIQDIESIHKPISKHKKEALLNALEDIAHFDYGFKNQILYALSLLRPKKENDDEESNEVFRMTSAKDLRSVENECEEIELKKENIAKRISYLKEKLNILENKEKHMKDDIEKMRDQLMYKNHKFEQFRTIRDKLDVLQTAFDTIFSHRDDDKPDQNIADLLKENHNLRKRLMKLKFELYTVNQITRRLQFIEEDEN